MMIEFVLFDDQSHSSFFPFTLTRPVSELRLGIRTIREKWESALLGQASLITAPWLAEKFGKIPNQSSPVLCINSRYLPCPALLEILDELKPGKIIQDMGVPVAFWSSGEPGNFFGHSETLEPQNLADHAIKKITKVWEIFSRNAEWIRDDFQVITAGRVSAPVSSTNRVMGEEIFFEPGAKAEMSILNATTGPIYVAAGAEIMEGSMVRGGLAMLEESALKMGAKIYGPSTFGPHVKVGGEVNNSVILGYSNKGHDGFLGNSVIGEWCNLGADTNNSNLKNNYGEVKIWDMGASQMVSTGLQFCGLFMGDHCKSGINTMFNTGTVAGVCANIFDAGFPPKFIPSFSWGTSGASEVYNIDKAIYTARSMYARRGLEFSPADERLLRFLHQTYAG